MQRLTDRLLREKLPMASCAAATELQSDRDRGAAAHLHTPLLPGPSPALEAGLRLPCGAAALELLRWCLQGERRLLDRCCEPASTWRLRSWHGLNAAAGCAAAPTARRRNRCRCSRAPRRRWPLKEAVTRKGPLRKRRSALGRCTDQPEEGLHRMRRGRHAKALLRLLLLLHGVGRCARAASNAGCDAPSDTASEGGRQHGAHWCE
mmetsp:Transcript_66198/g.183278  ORF Transcript_66198/g.183278 Transcript_66198/m.183278 type:complete len:206 (+) Transcript_66198:162-779(+)